MLLCSAILPSEEIIFYILGHFVTERGAMSNPASVSPAPAGVVAVSAKTWRTEDWIAVVLGFLVIALVLVAFQWKMVDLRNLVPTFRWTPTARSRR